MPRLDDRGVPTPALGAFWYDTAGRLVAQDCSSGVCVLRLSDGTQVADRGCNDLAANGASAWVAWLAGYGVFDSFGRHFPDSGIEAGAMGPDGSYAIKVARNSYGPWDVIRPDGSRWRLTEGDARNLQILRAGVLWTEDDRVRATFPLLGDPNGEPVWSPRAAEDGALLYQHRPEGSLVLCGRVIGPPSANYFNPDVRLVGNEYVVTWSPSQADTNAQILRIPRARLADYPPVGAAIPPVQPVPDPVPPIQEPAVSVPDDSGFVRDFLAPRLTRLASEDATRANSYAAVDACCAELRRHSNPRYGVLLKTSGDAVRERAADILLYDLGDGTAQVIDVVSDAEGHDGTPSPGWSLKDIRPISQWRTPYGDVPQPVPDPDPQPQPEPPSGDFEARFKAIEDDIRALKAWTQGVK